MDDEHVLNSQPPVGAQVEEAQGVGLLGLGLGLGSGLALTLTLTLAGCGPARAWPTR